MSHIKDFIDFCVKLGFEFHGPIQLNENDCFSSDLVELFNITNGQNQDNEPLFRRKYSQNFIKYYFLDWDNTQGLTNWIHSEKQFEKAISKQLIHFAAEKSNDTKKSSSTLAIDSNNIIYKCTLSKSSTFNIINEISQIKIYDNLITFLEEQRKLISLDFQYNYKYR